MCGKLKRLHLFMKEFTIQVKPNTGAVVIVNRTAPSEFKTVQNIE